jgi:hypothetical protein
LADAELVCLAVAQVLLGIDGEHRWIRCWPQRSRPVAQRMLQIVEPLVPRHPDTYRFIDGRLGHAVHSGTGASWGTSMGSRS